MKASSRKARDARALKAMLRRPVVLEVAGMQVAMTVEPIKEEAPKPRHRSTLALSSSLVGLLGLSLGVPAMPVKRGEGKSPDTGLPTMSGAYGSLSLPKRS